MGLDRISFFGVEVVMARDCVAQCRQMLRWNKRGAVCAIMCAMRSMLLDDDA